MTWPAHLQTLTFGEQFQSEPGQRNMASSSSKFDFWCDSQAELGQGDMARGPTEFDFWRKFQSVPGQRDMASRPSMLDFWNVYFNQSLQNVTWPARPSKFDVW